MIQCHDEEIIGSFYDKELQNTILQNELLSSI